MELPESSSARTFTDALNRSWTVTIDMAGDRRLRAVTGVSLVDLVPIGEPKKNAKKSGDFASLSEFMSDPYRVFDAFYALVKPQADARNIDRDGVVDGIDEEASKKMWGAVIRAVHDFFPNDPMRKAALRRMEKMTTQLSEKMTEKVGMEMDKIDLDAIVDAMPTLDGVTATNDVIARLRNYASITADTSASAPTL